MKRALSLCLALPLALSLTACGGAGGSSSLPGAGSGSIAPAASAESVPAQSVPDSHPTLVRSEDGKEERKDGDKVLLDAKWQTPTVADPDHKAVEQAIQGDLDQILKSFQKGSDEIFELARSDYQANGPDAEFPVFPYYHSLTVSQARADRGVLSLVFDEGSYQGGAHGGDYRYGRSYDASTGQVLRLADLGEEVPAAAKPVILSFVRDIHERDKLFFDDVSEEDLKYVVTDDLFYFSEDGLVFLSGEYALQSYAEGIVSFTISYDDLSGKLKDAYNPGGGVTKCDTATGTYTLQADGSLEFTPSPEEAEAAPAGSS